MTAIFLTVALVSSAVEAGVIRINGTIAGSESGAPFPDPAEGDLCQWERHVNRHGAWSIHTVIRSSGLRFRVYATWEPRGKSF